MSDEKRASTPIDQMLVVRKDELESSFKRLAQQLEATAPASMTAVRNYRARRAARAQWPGVNGSITIPERPIRHVVPTNRKTLRYRTTTTVNFAVLIAGGIVLHFYFEF